ncbi:hypothetical protein SUGI_0105090 [Cryptomeria japonica]|nr:hypothetical protein SUGI_0105090 [Cryptomeria japonica]
MAYYAVAQVFLVLVLLFCSASANANFSTDFDITWGGYEHANILENGRSLNLLLDNTSGAGCQSKKEYLFGKIDMQIKLVPGNSAGTVTAYYLSSQGPNHDEIDFEFLGNVSGDPYIVHTNVFTQGQGNREQQFYLWFDPTKDFHTYSILWSPQQIVFLVDGSPIRVFHNNEELGVAYPNKQAMRMYSSLWNGEDWATRGGLVKTDWNSAPFIACFRKFKVEACKIKKNASPPSCSVASEHKWWNQDTQQERLKWVQQNYMIYNYCADTRRFPLGLPPECNAP